MNSIEEDMPSVSSKEGLIPPFKPKRRKFYLFPIRYCCLSFVSLVSLTFFLVILSAMLAVLVPALMLMYRTQKDKSRLGTGCNRVRLVRYLDVMFADLRHSSKIIAQTFDKTDLFYFDSEQPLNLSADVRLLSHLRRFEMCTFCSIAFSNYEGMESTYFGYQRREEGEIYLWEQYNEPDLVGYSIDMKTGEALEFQSAIANFSVGGRPYYRPEETEGYVGDVYFSYCGEMSIYVVFPLFDENGTAVGIVKNNFNLELLTSFLSEYFSETMVLVDRKCNIIGASDPSLLPPRMDEDGEFRHVQVDEIKHEKMAKAARNYMIPLDDNEEEFLCEPEGDFSDMQVGGTFHSFPYEVQNQIWMILVWEESVEYLIFILAIPIMFSVSFFTAMLSMLIVCCFITFLTMELRRPLMLLKKNFKPMLELQTDEYIPQTRRSCVTEVNQLNDSIMCTARLIDRLRTFLPNPIKQVAAHETGDGKGENGMEFHRRRRSSSHKLNKEGMIAQKMKLNFKLGLVRVRMGVIVTLRIKQVEVVNSMPNSVGGGEDRDGLDNNNYNNNMFMDISSLGSDDHLSSSNTGSKAQMGIYPCHREVYEIVESVRQELCGNLLHFTDRKYVVGFFEKNLIRISSDCDNNNNNNKKKKKRKKKKKKSKKKGKKKKNFVDSFLSRSSSSHEIIKEAGSTNNTNEMDEGGEEEEEEEGDLRRRRKKKRRRSEGDDMMSNQSSESSGSGNSNDSSSESDFDEDEMEVVVNRGKYERRACRFALLVRNQLEVVASEYSIKYSFGIDKSLTKSGFLGSVEKKLPQFTGSAKRLSNILAKYGIDNNIRIVLSENLEHLSIHYERVKIDYLYLPRIFHPTKLSFIYQLTRIRKISEDLETLKNIDGSSTTASKKKKKKLKRKNSVSKLFNQYEKSIFLNERCWEYLINDKLKKCNAVFRKCKWRAFTKLSQLVHFLQKFNLTFEEYVKRVIGEERLKECTYLSLLMPELQEVVLKDRS